MKRFFYWITGGRPMTRGEWRFNDCVSGREVYIYTDKFGRKWLAHSPWASFRVRPLY